MPSSLSDSSERKTLPDSSERLSTSDSDLSHRVAIIFVPNVPDHLPRTAGAADAGSEATKHLA